MDAVAIKDGKIVEIGPNLAATGATEIDATGKIVAPACACACRASDHVRLQQKVVPTLPDTFPRYCVGQG